MAERTVATQLVELSIETTSPGYIVEPSVFREYVDHPDRNLHVYYEHGPEGGTREVTDVDDLDRTDWNVIAFALSGRYDRSAYADVVNVPIETILSATPLRDDDFPLSVVKVIAVDPVYQGRGVGTEISAIVAAKLFKHPPVVTMIWLRDNVANVRIAERYSDFRLATFREYFPSTWSCPECGFENDCSCDVAMYGWFADGREVGSPVDVESPSDAGTVDDDRTPTETPTEVVTE